MAGRWRYLVCMRATGAEGDAEYCDVIALKPKSKTAMKIERINIPALGLPAGPYSHAMRHGDQIYTSGFTAFATEAQKAPIADQVLAIFSQLLVITNAQNTSMANLIKVTIFITDAKVIPALREALSYQYGEHIPASSMVMVAALFSSDLLVEIEAIFAV
jgi:2-iminobutanoate/2-iminopropanoate deaminase